MEGDGAAETAAEEAAGDGQQGPPLDKEQEAAEAKYRALEKEFRTKVGLDIPVED